MVNTPDASVAPPLKMEDCVPPGAVITFLDPQHIAVLYHLARQHL